MCDLKKGDRVKIAGPFGSTFLMPDDQPRRGLLMICTGTGSAPFRGFTMRRQRVGGAGDMMLVFGARAPDALPYFGPLAQDPRQPCCASISCSAAWPARKRNMCRTGCWPRPRPSPTCWPIRNTHIYVCGLRGMEAGVEQAFVGVAESVGLSWEALRETLRAEGRYHVETY